MEEIDNFIKMIESHKYKEAHEELEDKWKEFRTNEKIDESNILKAFINAATYFELKRLKRESAFKVWKTYEKYIPLLNDLESEHKKSYIECKKVLQALYSTHRP